MSDHQQGEPLAAFLRRMRLEGRVAVARAVLADHLRQHPDPRLAELAWQHEPFWWEDLLGRRVRLRRRGPGDVALIRQLWGDTTFMRRFNRVAPGLPADDAELSALLGRERASVLGEARSLHWVIEDGATACGLVSVVDCSLQHRRGEFQIGVLPGTRTWVAPEAAHLALWFLARQAGLERLTAYFYPENTPAISAAQRLGFTLEGRLAGYIRLAGEPRCDLVVAGLLLDDAYFERTARVRSRLLPGLN